MSKVSIDQLLDKYTKPVPRYTSYPTALDWQQDFSDGTFLQALSNCQDYDFNGYIHIPFCHRRCLYCGCNVIINRRQDLADKYLDSLEKEIEYKVNQLVHRPRLRTLHFGGGTPNFLTPHQQDRLFRILHNQFQFDSNSEISIELDAMLLSKDYLSHLADLGVNRVSFGIQDVNKQTLEAVNRPQDLLHLNKILAHAKALPFKSINYDFIYGLPYQTIDSFKHNLQWIQMYRPDRIALFGYAHVPWVKKHQRQLPFKALPDRKLRFDLSQEAKEYLQGIGYNTIGIDHFALPSDDLSIARLDGNLSRNFMGYTTWGNLNILAFGLSSVSYVDGVFAQNHNKLRAYENACESKENWFEKGKVLSQDDKIRAKIIEAVMVHGFLDKEAWSEKLSINFDNYFRGELEALKEFTDIDAVRIEEGLIKLTSLGQLISRHIAQLFDTYRRQIDPNKSGFSKAI